MQEAVVGPLKVCLSEEVVAELPDDHKRRRDFFEDALLSMSRPEYFETLRDYRIKGKHRNPKLEVAMLVAHGISYGGNWNYYDDDKPHPVQDWINRNDGKARVLIAYPCNPNIVSIKSKRSLVLHARGIASFDDYKAFSQKARLYVPGQGYLDPDPRFYERPLNWLQFVGLSMRQLVGI